MPASSTTSDEALTSAPSPQPIARKTPPQFAQYKKIRPGTAKEAELIEQYLPFVKNVVGRLALSLPSHVDLDDLYSAGLVGLLNAVRNFDPTAGSSFESYARVRIRGAIFDELRRLDWVPRSVHDKARKVQAVIQQIEQSKGQPPTDGEIAAAQAHGGGGGKLQQHPVADPELLIRRRTQPGFRGSVTAVTMKQRHQHAGVDVAGGWPAAHRS